MSGPESWKVTAQGSRAVITAALLAHEEAGDWDHAIVLGGSTQFSGGMESLESASLGSPLFAAPLTDDLPPEMTWVGSTISSAKSSTAGSHEEQASDAIFHSLELSSVLGSSELELGWVSG